MLTRRPLLAFHAPLQLVVFIFALLAAGSFMISPVRADGDTTVTSEAGARAAVAQRLVDLGTDSQSANEMAGQLTPEDLAVLMDNPRMMQRAGARNQFNQAVFWTVVILVGLVALGVAAGSGSLSIH